MYLKAILRFILWYHTLPIGIYLFHIIYIKNWLHLPGPGEKDSAHSEGNFNFDPIVKFLMFSLSFLKSYSPGPGLWVWLNIETDLQSSLPCPIVIPCFGLGWNSEESEYLSGDGDCLLLYENRITEQYPLYLHIQMMGLVCLAWRSFHRSESWMRWMYLA